MQLWCGCARRLQNYSSAEKSTRKRTIVAARLALLATIVICKHPNGFEHPASRGHRCRRYVSTFGRAAFCGRAVAPAGAWSRGSGETCRDLWLDVCFSLDVWHRRQLPDAAAPLETQAPPERTAPSARAPAPARLRTRSATARRAWAQAPVRTLVPVRARARGVRPVQCRRPRSTGERPPSAICRATCSRFSRHDANRATRLRLPERRCLS